MRKDRDPFPVFLLLSLLMGVALFTLLHIGQARSDSRTAAIVLHELASATPKPDQPSQ
jgi:hypothetical protein